MDIVAARSLQTRLEQQKHWQQADAVREGRQLPVDPDGDQLEALGEGVRFYSGQQAAKERVCKRLVDGRWRRVEIGEAGASAERGG